MALIDINKQIDKTIRINGRLEIDDGTDQKKLIFVQGIKITIDATLLQRDSIGSGTSVFTQNGDVIGSFEFPIRNTVDMFSDVTPAVDISTISFWIQKIIDDDPAQVDFIQTFNAPKSPGDKFARVKFRGRIMTPDMQGSVDDALEDIIITGEIMTTPTPTTQRVAA